MILKKIFVLFILTSLERCWACKSQDKGETERLFKRSILPEDQNVESNDYGFYLNDFTGETVMNGNEALPHQYPWMVYVCGKIDLDVMKCNESCGGTLIHRQYVLTAAHCVAGGSINDTFVVLGAHNLNEKMQMQEWSFLDDIILHPEYDETREKEYKRSPDVALLKLTEMVVFGPGVNAISLPDFSQVNKNYENEHGIVAGWGVRDYDGTPITSQDKLMETTVKIRSSSWCKTRGKLSKFIKR